MGQFDTFTITVDGEARTYTKAFVPKYAKQLAAGNTVCAKADLVGGVSYMRVSHESQGGIQRHLVSVEDKYIDGEGNESIDKVHRVLSCKDTDPAAEARLELLSAGVDSWLDTAGLQTSIVNGEL
jgi:hypothetical protein